MIWPFRKSEERAGGSQQHTATAVAELEARAYGTNASPETIALVEACTGLWERCIASAAITPDNTLELEAVTPQMLALAGRNLAMRGNALFAIQVEGGRVVLTPASYWDIYGTARTQRYRLDLAGPSRVETVNLPAASVLHFRIGADPRTPWRGRGPLERATGSAAMASSIEAALAKESRAPVGRLWEVNPQSMPPESVDEAKQLVGAGGNVTVAGGSDVKMTAYGPDPAEAVITLRTTLGRDLGSAYGVSPALFSERGDGAGQREAWRRFWLSTIAPLGRTIEAELQAKLHTAAMVGFSALRAADKDGESRAAQRRANAYKIYRDAGREHEEAMRLAGVE